MPIEVNIKGIQKAQAANTRAINALKPAHALGKALKETIAFLHARVVEVTPKDTGALQASHRMKIDTRQVVSRISIDRTARNPRSGMRTAEYGYYLHQRGHKKGLNPNAETWQDFYAHVHKVFGMKALKMAADIIKRALP